MLLYATWKDSYWSLFSDVKTLKLCVNDGFILLDLVYLQITPQKLIQFVQLTIDQSIADHRSTGK